MNISRQSIADEILKNKGYTFHEAAEILEPILNTTDLNSLLINSGYFDNNGFPSRRSIAKNVFRIGDLVATGNESNILCKVISITHAGMVLIINKAFIHYHKVEAACINNPDYSERLDKVNDLFLKALHLRFND